MATIQVQTCSSFEEFVETIGDLKGPSVVKLADYGVVEPKRSGGSVWMQPMVVVVATAVDMKESRILRWEEKREARQMVSIIAGTGRGMHNDGDLVAKVQLLRGELELHGFKVSEGEWTPENVAAILGARNKGTGK